MGRRYTASYTGTFTNAGANADLLEVLPADDKPTRLLGFIISQISEVGDSAEEGISVSVMRLGATVTSSNGTSVTPAALDATNNVAYGGTVEANGATVATTSGTTTTLMELGWNIRVPLEWYAPDPEFAPVVRQTEGLFIRANTTPADDITIAITAFLEEI